MVLLRLIPNSHLQLVRLCSLSTKSQLLPLSIWLLLSNHLFSIKLLLHLLGLALSLFLLRFRTPIPFVLMLPTMLSVILFPCFLSHLLPSSRQYFFDCRSSFYFWTSSCFENFFVLPDSCCCIYRSSRRSFYRRQRNRWLDWAVQILSRSVQIAFAQHSLSWTQLLALCTETIHYLASCRNVTIQQTTSLLWPFLCCQVWFYCSSGQTTCEDHSVTPGSAATILRRCLPPRSSPAYKEAKHYVLLMLLRQPRSPSVT